MVARTAAVITVFMWLGPRLKVPKHMTPNGSSMQLLAKMTASLALAGCCCGQTVLRVPVPIQPVQLTSCLVR